jgi:hypothetical protein
MDDRTWVVASILRFAEALCATLVVPAPCRMLGGYGAVPQCLNDSFSNKQVAASTRSSSWERYVDWGDRRDMVVESNTLVASSPEVPYSEGVAWALADSDHLARRRVARGDLRAAVELHKQRLPFVLTVPVRRYDFFKHFLACQDVDATLRDGGHCRSVERLPSRLALNVAERMLAKAGVAPHLHPTTSRGDEGGGGGDSAQRITRYAIVLLRREHHAGGGSKGVSSSTGCDNSPERVRQFLACRLLLQPSTNGTAAAARKLPALFFFTDEKDSGYLRKLARVAGDFADLVVHGDAEARGHLLRLGTPGAAEDRHLTYVAHHMRTFNSPPHAQTPCCRASYIILGGARRVTRLCL